MFIRQRILLSTYGFVRLSSKEIHKQLLNRSSLVTKNSTHSLSTESGKLSKSTVISWTHQRAMDRKAPEGVFPSTRDRFRGITVDTDQTSIDFPNFPQQLKKSLEWWAQQDSRAIWFKINLKSTAIVPVLAENSFNFHHARDGFVMMIRWLSDKEPSNIPPFAHTMVGVGGIVINAKDQILSISEKQSIVPGSWKLPGGYVEPDENLVDAGIREVFEETGIQTQFDSLVSVRHSHNSNFGCSDLYMVMALRTIGDQAADGTPIAINACPREIAAAKWMEFDEYVNHPNVHELNRDLLRQYLKNRSAGVLMTCKEGVHPLLRRKYNVYSLDFHSDAKL